MAKRTAATELTDRNWDQEDEPEEAGTFTQASKDVMKKRQVIKAKRKGLSTEGGSSSFTGFSGFSFKPTNTSTPFSFNVKSVTNGDSKPDSSTNDNKISSSSTSETKLQDQKTEVSSSNQKQNYSENLRKLNESVLSWIQKHVEKNPYCILTPIFNDYDKHLGELEKEKEASNSENETKNSVKSDEDSTSPAAGSTATTVTTTTEIKFGFSTTTSAPALSSGFFSSAATAAASSNGSTATKAPAFSGFNFKPSEAPKPAFSFAVGNSAPSAGDSAPSSQEEEEYVPPVPEVKTVEEEGSLFTMKCKLFYQKDGKWVDRGVGFLHLKKADEKLQLLIRADTNLGNILLNIILSASIPVNRKGNNVSLMCVPNPPVDPKLSPKATPMLIRVKKEDDAQTLLDKIKELKE